jgi:hypothetical protein
MVTFCGLLLPETRPGSRTTSNLGTVLAPLPRQHGTHLLGYYLLKIAWDLSNVHTLAQASSQAVQERRLAVLERRLRRLSQRSTRPLRLSCRQEGVCGRRGRR